MKKILVVSDNHFQDQPLANILQRHTDVDYFIHCGDSQWQTDEQLFKKFIAVRGNNDFVPFPEEEVLTIESRKVLILHGDEQYVFNFGDNPNLSGTEELVTYGLNVQQANVIFYGHTHVAEAHVDRGVFVLNPGSLNYPRGRALRIPTYAIVTIDGLDVEAQFYDANSGADLTEKVLKGK